MRKSDLPFGSEFSPSNIELDRVLELGHRHGGDWRAFEAAVHDEFFNPQRFPATSEYNRRKRANNVKLGMQAYGLIDGDAKLTDVGSRIFESRADRKAAYTLLARHILLNLHGMTLIQTIGDMQIGGDPITLVTLRGAMAERGVHFPRGGKHPSMMRLWLEKAGIFATGYRINEARLDEVLGLPSSEMELLAKLSPQQRSFLKTLINLDPSLPIPAQSIEKAATATYGQKFNEKSLTKDVLYPLEKAGYIKLQKETRAKSPMVSATDKLVAEIVAPLLSQLEKQTDADLRPLLRKKLPDIVAELSSNDRHTKGLALEALAFKLMRLIDLDYVATRLRGTATGGAEVDVIFQSTRLVFSRWQVQCKNTTAVSLEDVAKEVGLYRFLKSNVIVVISTGKIGPTARSYANDEMEATNICLVMIDGDDIRQIIRDPAAILTVLAKESQNGTKWPLWRREEIPFSAPPIGTSYWSATPLQVMSPRGA